MEKESNFFISVA